MLDDGSPLTLRDYWGIVVRRRLTALAVVATCVGAALALVVTTDRLYRAETVVLVRSTTSTAVFGTGTQANSDARRRVANEISVLEGVEVRERVRTDLGRTGLPPRVTGASNATDDVVTVSVASADPVEAATVANAYVVAYNEVKREQVLADLARAVDELQGQISRLQVEIDDLDVLLDDPDLVPQDRDLLETRRRELVAQQSVFQRSLDQRQVDANLVTSPAQVIEPATVPTEPFQPAPTRTGLLGLFVGLVLGIGAALLRERLDQSIKTDSDLAKIGTTLPLLAQVPASPVAGQVAVLRPTDEAIEHYRSLRTNMQFVAIDRDMKVLQVTSALPGEGKTTTAANLALVLAQTDLKVLLLDGDLRKPMVHEAFGITSGIGLVDVLVGRPIDDAVHRVSDHLDVIPAGSVPVNPSELLSSRRMGDVVDAIRSRYDFVVIDSAPVLPVSDAAALSRHADGVLVVVHAGRATVPQVREAISLLDRVQAPLIGVVLNRVKRSARAHYGYGYGHRGGAQQKTIG